MKALHHQKEYEWWRTHGHRKDLPTSREFKCNRKTIGRWRIAEDWEARANIDDAKEKQKITAEAIKHLDEGETAVQRARDNHGAFQGCVTALNQMTVDYVRYKMLGEKPKGMSKEQEPAEPPWWVWLSATRADVEMTAKLYGIPQRLDINVNTPKSPGDQLAEEIMSAGTELRDVIQEYVKLHQPQQPKAKA